MTTVLSDYLFFGKVVGKILIRPLVEASRHSFCILCLNLRGSAVRFFLFVFFVSGSASFVRFYSFLSLRVAVWNKFSGASFCFLWSVVVLCFSVVFCPGFRFMVWRLAPETVRTNCLHVRSLVLGSFSLS